jgi:hypothetical protein
MNGILAALLRSRVSALGIGLSASSALLFVLLVTLDGFGYFDNPYAGLFVFIGVPAIFVVGLLLIPVGVWRDRRRVRAGVVEPWPTFRLSDPNVRRALGFLVAATIVNLAIVSFASFGAVEYTESQAFCGQTCHPVMKPEFTAHGDGTHARVHCVACHVGPGAGAFLNAKFNGTRQLWLVASHAYRRPIPTPIDSLPAVSETCEQCHFPNRFIGDVTKVIYEYADDAANTPTATTVKLHVGGPVSGTGTGTGIHWHMNRANRVEYIALDEKREQIGYVRITPPDGKSREYFAEGVKAADFEGKPLRRMGCTDCHSRPAHTFGTTPERAVDKAIGEGLIDAKLPFIRREAVRALRASYPSQEAAAEQIDTSIRTALKAELPPGFDEAALRRSIGVTQAIYRRSIFPEMNVTWGTYPNQLGHMTSNGCFRCHDESHKTRDGLTIKQDCESCHAIE